MENASKALIIAGAILISILLISIGIILINSGRDVTDAGTSSMASQRIQSFNNQFTAYEGTKTGSEIRGLISAVNASNVTDESHQVTIQAKTGQQGAPASASDINNTKKYTVSISYAKGDNTDTVSGTSIAGPTSVTTEKGYIYKIEIGNV